MPFKVINGTFHVVNYSPDGDSIRFKPDNAALLGQLTGFTARVNPRGHVQLRIEAIDALETHYSPPLGGGVLHQPLLPARAAMVSLLRFAGIQHEVWDATHSMITAASDGTPGHILARSVEKNGRPVAFVFNGPSPEIDGSDVHLDAPRATNSFNYQALKEGHAYPTYYHGLFNDLRDHLGSAVADARVHQRGVYQIDLTTEGFEAATLPAITSETAILPKLFRRLAEYMVNYGTAKGFKAKLRQSREPVLDLTTMNFTFFDTFVEQEEDSSKIRMTRRPEELVFDEMPNRPPNAFSALMGEATEIPRGPVRIGALPENAVLETWL